MEEVWNQRLEASIHELLDPSAVGHMEGGDVRGIDEFKSVRAGFLDAFPDMKLTIEDILAEKEQAVVRWSIQGTHSGWGLGLEPTNRTYTFRGMSWLRITDGIIREGWDSWNLGALLQSLEAKPGSGGPEGSSVQDTAKKAGRP